MAGRGGMIAVIRITGKARDVFTAIRVIAHKAGKLTISEIVRLKSR